MNDTHLFLLWKKYLDENVVIVLVNPNAINYDYAYSIIVLEIIVNGPNVT